MNSQLLNGQFPYLQSGQVYADWTGAALPPVSLIDEWSDHLRNILLGNPHSGHEPSLRAAEEIEAAREAVLQFLNADPKEYEVIFTSGATEAIRLLEHYNFGVGGQLLLTADNHNSINGLRETAKRSGAIFTYAPIKGVGEGLVLDTQELTRLLNYPRSRYGNRLFAYPAKSNYSGNLHSLHWVDYAHRRGWDVLLDAAAFLANDQLDLSQVKPDFVPISFYKLFGFPTGVGALVIHRRMFTKLHKKWFTGGPIMLVSVQRDFFVPDARGATRYEDGSPNFGMIGAVKNGLDFLNSLGGDRKAHAVAIANDVWDILYETKENSNAQIIIHTPRGNDIIAFSVVKDGKIINPGLFEKMTSDRGFFVRVGCFCNPGVNEKIHGYSVDEVIPRATDEVIFGLEEIKRRRQYFARTAVGSIRASFGYSNSTIDVIRISGHMKNILREI
ncbi:MAG TPA: aminotransferase class V-fold PLP-dependent enzyme [Candidatus Magasanikbacteria bacterium]|jgi:selenocysteine lyase/cysteine desulfurase|nr:aminotransferase class V-fold PLP-dependent enzyme [Candidatus Magasanikbacteria bacterium]HQF57180.1 aminotransferase class V-fold PLP-dependent enzyme [Candidatus Magasanikbacteria bacterium]HQL52492.1 aminotransferase class V-fold PLP-dependent enzyme [Candidatus Magasanikbacteria bacterium]